MNITENSESNWPDEFLELKSIEDSLTCGICYEYMQTVVMTPCSHNYCSLCIRRYLNFKNECPACFNQVFDTDLRVNRTLDNIKQNFLKVRDKLKLCMKGLPIRPTFERPVTVESTTPVKSRINQLASTPRTGSKSPSGLRNEENFTPSRPNRNSHLVSSPHTPNRSRNKSTSDADSTSQSGNIEKHIFSPSTSGMASIFNPGRSKPFGKKEDIGPTVPCPVCAVSVSEKHINKHLDACLKRQSNTSGPVTTESKLKPIPKLVLNLMKDSELRRRLKEYGISTVGDSKALKTRLNRFCILYNAERDKAVQRSVAEIVKQCEDEEQHEKKMVLPSSGNMLAFNKVQNVKPVKGQNEEYCEANKSSFEKLIKQVKSRNNSKKKTSPREEETIDLTALNEDVSENATNISNDSDSGTSSLFQRESNEGPRKSVEVQFSGEELKESCLDNSEADSAVESNRIDDSTDGETNFSSPRQNDRQKRAKEKMDFASTSMIDTSNDSEMNAQSPVNKRTAINTFEEDFEHVSNSSDSNFAGFEKPEIKKSNFSLKRPRMSKLSFASNNETSLPLNFSDVQALDKLLENREEDLNVSLDISADSVGSSASKVDENIEEMLETDINTNIEEGVSGLENGDKENEPLSVEEGKTVNPRPVRKRSRPSRYLNETPSKSNIQNVLNDSKEFEAALDESLDEIESSPEKVLKRRRGRPKSNVETEVETPKRILRRRNVGESSKQSINNH